MTKLREIYKCAICGNSVEVVHDGTVGREGPRRWE